MPLHDWANLSGWDGVHQVWIVELLYAVKPLLPPRYRAYIGTRPTFVVGGRSTAWPDVGVQDWPPAPPPVTSNLLMSDEPEEEVVVAVSPDPDTTVLIESEGRLVAAIELVSPRNKDRDSARDTYTSAYFSYLLRGVHLLLVDVHRRPLGFSFADRLTTEFGLERPPLPSPFAVAYRVGEQVPGGRLLAIWRRTLTVGEALPILPLPLSVTESVRVDLNSTYQRAAEAAYLG